MSQVDLSPASTDLKFVVKEVPQIRQTGELRVWRDECGHTLQLLTVPDLDGRLMCLPQYRSDLVVGGEVPQDLKKRGVDSFHEATINAETNAYFQKALTRLPVLLAVHATFNMDIRPDLDQFPNTFPTPIIGVEGPPWSGKTFFLLTEALLNDDQFFGVRDFDPFGIESLSNCLADVRVIGHNDPNYFKESMHRTVEAVQRVYTQKRKRGQIPDTSQVTLAGKLNTLLDEYRGGNRRYHYLLDLPGVGSHSAPPHIFQLLRFSLPTINLVEALKNDPDLAGTVLPGVKVPLEKKYPYVDPMVSPVAYFIHLRRQLINPMNQVSGDSLLNRALTENYLRHTAAIKLTEPSSL
jgi:hypothetical protein